MKAPLAVVTMVYNEAAFLPVWLRHYGRQVPPEACHVIDHGSDDGSTASLGRVSCWRIPRSPQDDERRAGAISHYCAALLAWYDAVIYVDVDELLVVDPLVPGGLAGLTRLAQSPVLTATGFDVVHVPGEEAAIDWSAPVSAQRSWLRFSSAMCKPAVLRAPLRWVPGFHNIEGLAPALDMPLFLFHLRYADLGDGLERLNRTRNQPWASPDAGAHQRMSDEHWAGMLQGMADLPRRDNATLDSDDPVLREWRQRVEGSARGRETERYSLDLHISGDALWRLPDRLRGTF